VVPRGGSFARSIPFMVAAGAETHLRSSLGRRARSLALVRTSLLEPPELLRETEALFLALGLERTPLRVRALFFGGLAFFGETPLLGLFGAMLLFGTAGRLDLTLGLGLDLLGAAIGFGCNAPFLGFLGAALLVGAACLSCAARRSASTASRRFSASSARR
jgi:hypothetical protein